MRWNLVGAFIRNNPFGTEIAFRKGLERIGEQVTCVDPSYPDQRFDDSPDVTIVFKWLDEGPYRTKLAQLPGLKFVYQVDDLRFDHIKDMMIKMRQVCDHALTFDQDGAELAKRYGYESATRLLLTADDHLYRPVPNSPKLLDVCFVGSLSNGPNHKSRVKMLEMAKGHFPGLRLGVASELFDISRIRSIYASSKVVLNHATDVGQDFGHGYGYQCRHFEAGFVGSVLLSNTVDNDSVLRNFVTFSSEVDFLSKLDFLLKLSDKDRQIIADLFYAELNTFHRPENRAKELVEIVRSLQ